MTLHVVLTSLKCRGMPTTLARLTLIIMGLRELNFLLGEPLVADAVVSSPDTTTSFAQPRSIPSLSLPLLLAVTLLLSV